MTAATAAPTHRAMQRPALYVVPVCPFCQRAEVMLALKGAPDAVELRTVDITRPRDPEFLALTRGTTATPVLVTGRGVLKESLVLMRYLDATVAGPRVTRDDPFERAVEDALLAMEGDFSAAGYRFVLNQDPAQRDALERAYLAQVARIDDYLRWRSPDGDFLFDRFGLAECAFTPLLQRFWFLDYYEGFALPADRFARFARWRDACLAHPAAQQVTFEQIIKSYYDYALGAGNGALLPGRAVSSFALSPDWRARPMPPRDKYRHRATDAELGLV